MLSMKLEWKGEFGRQKSEWRLGQKNVRVTPNAPALPNSKENDPARNSTLFQLGTINTPLPITSWIIYAAKE